MTKKKSALYLDDHLTPTETIPGYNPWNVVRNYNEFTEWILKNGIPDLISFDHDLAEEHITDYFNQFMINGYQHPNYDSYKEKTGLDCAKWLCEKYCFPTNLELKQCAVHSDNPVGSRNIHSYINGYLKHMDKEETCYIGKFPFIIEKK
jgi:hypothetical protein